MLAHVQAVFVVNPTSGGRAGAALFRRLQAAGEPVHDLRAGGLVRLAETCPGPLVACGGDGTAAAVLDAVFRSGRDVPVAVVPLGTGNDLARYLGWPTSPPDMAMLQTWLAHAIAAPERRLDRWILSGPGVERAWFNYWSLGDDAAAASRFHHIRRVQPWLTSSRIVNKMLYAACGLQECGTRLRGNLAGLPSGTGALVVAGIPSYAGGLRLGRRIAADDGLLDLFALPQGIGLGLVLARIRSARALGRCRSVEFRLTRRTPMQLDGEPLSGTQGIWRASHAGQVRVLAGPAQAVV